MPNRNKNKYNDKYNNDGSRKGAPNITEGLTTRSLTMLPNSFRESDSSVEFTLTTEQPTRVWDWDTWEIVEEVLIANGFEIYSGEQVPLVDSHSYESVGDILGSVRDIRAEGDSVVGRLYFSNTEKAQEALQKVREGHLTTGSIGYTRKETLVIKMGTTFIYEGIMYSAVNSDIHLTTKWSLKEFSLVAIPADNRATVRGDDGIVPDTNIKSGYNAEKENEMPGIITNKAADTAVVEQKQEKAVQKREQVQVQEQAQKPVQVDIEAVKAEAVKAEQERAAKIVDLCTRHDCTALQDELLRSGATVQEAQEKVLAAIETKSSVSTASRVEIGETDTEKKRDMYTQNILARAGIGESKYNKRMGFADIARSCLRDIGEDTYNLGKQDILVRAMSVSDFPLVLSNAAEKSILKGYDIGKQTWRIWAKEGSISDFKPAKRVDLSEAPELILNLPGEEIQHGVLGERGKEIALDTYARKLVITRHALVNDDQDLFKEIFFRFGQRAANQIEAAVYNVLTNNVDTIFSSGNKNIATGKGLISASLVQEALGLMGAQKGDKGAILSLMGKYLLGGFENMVPAQLHCNSTTDPTPKGNADVNPFREMGLVPVITGHITGKGWYMATDEIDTLEVAFLDGKSIPSIYSVEHENDILGQSFVAYIDYGIQCLDHRGLVKVDGQ